MFVKIHKSYRYVVAICDSELIGKTFQENNFQLEIKESFFNGNELSEKETEQIMQKMSLEDATFNLIGEKTINLALKLNLIQEQGIKKIQGIPFALVLL